MTNAPSAIVNVAKSYSSGDFWDSSTKPKEHQNVAREKRSNSENLPQNMFTRSWKDESLRFSPCCKKPPKKSFFKVFSRESSASVSLSAPATRVKCRTKSLLGCTVGEVTFFTRFEGEGQRDK